MNLELSSRVVIQARTINSCESLVPLVQQCTYLHRYPLQCFRSCFLILLRFIVCSGGIPHCFPQFGPGEMQQVQGCPSLPSVPSSPSLCKSSCIIRANTRAITYQLCMCLISRSHPKSLLYQVLDQSLLSQSPCAQDWTGLHFAC
jgi:hypothetical protein